MLVPYTLLSRIGKELHHATEIGGKCLSPRVRVLAGMDDWWTEGTIPMGTHREHQLTQMLPNT